MPLRSIFRIAGTFTMLVGACLTGCRLIGPSWRDVYHLATAPQQFTRVVGADHVVLVLVGVALWVLCGWLTIAIACWAGAALPGRSGRTLGRIAGLISPRLIRRALGIAVGISLGPGIVQVAAASPPAAPVAVVAELPQDGTTPSLTSGVDWPVDPAAPAATSTIAAHPGDCLWSLAEAHLGYGATIAEISSEVDRWWDANAEVIGGDPDLLFPGQVLVVPGS
ncbi:hypothetical protein CLV47_12051 [Antricoccus suffuscus]|uniref:LysM domain-containing protein n=1 Tax=Antricoccus suffuscus TaxID=1629062 RepID=A0A2T0ZQM4_9ACTN|nr:LysM peptidoglycan-binding domain-containing protein [Antricoccus suffuscus]PRZ38584.1 hypothetical protein CLV47_12051 [Antricoccus suffuscus]